MDIPPLGLVIPPPAGLDEALRCGIITLPPAGPYRLPAALHPLLFVVLRGAVTVHRDGHREPVAPFSLCGGTCRFQNVEATPGTTILAMALRPGGMGMLFGPGAGEVLDTIVPLDTLVATAAVDRFLDRVQDLAAVPDALAEVLAPAHRQAAAGCDRFEVPPPWLDLPVDTLADRFALGRRQFERRFLAAYGQPLRGYRRQVRAARTIVDFVAGRTSIERWAEVAAGAGYSDQAHMTRDLGRFTGYTPGRLGAALARGEPALWPYRVPAPVLTRLFGPTGF